MYKVFLLKVACEMGVFHKIDDILIVDIFRIQQVLCALILLRLQCYTSHVLTYLLNYYKDKLQPTVSGSLQASPDIKYTSV